MESMLQTCATRDRHRLSTLVRQLQRTRPDSADYPLLEQKVLDALKSSCAHTQSRAKLVPAIRFPENLPVSERRADIAEAIRDHQVVVVAGDTGSGKTTQLPKICLELGLGVRGMIGHTQPRRLAARAVAARIAEELAVPLGGIVGYQVRFSDQTSADTLVKLMTDGILLQEIQHDPYLNRYEVLIVDEAHERSLNIDFLLGYLSRLLLKRPDLKLIITSATIDVEKFAVHFRDAPIVSVAGRTYPVEIVYRPVENVEEQADDILTQSIIDALREIEQLEGGKPPLLRDVLVFLSGEREIRDVAHALRKAELRHTEILPLYARLTPAEQQKIFLPMKGRKIVLATNVAETSITVPGIAYVIDSGLARVSRYSVQSKVQRLPIERVSQASANQRAGRCGRVGPGVCFRLYSAEDFAARPPFTEPEIQRTNLSAVILQMLALGLGEIDAFPFLDKPDRRAINDGLKLLQELGALNEQRQLTHVGRLLAALPVDPRLGAMLIDADARRCLQELLIIVSALSVQDPREFPAEMKQASREKHAMFAHKDSDFLSWILLWSEFERQRQTLSNSALKDYCRRHFLSSQRMREWRETHRQMHLTCQSLGFRENRRADVAVDMQDLDYEAIHRAIIRGSLNQIGVKTEDGQYLGSRGRKFALFPTSTLARRGPKWVVTAELMETSRLYATLAASIQPEWVEDAAAELLRHEYSEPHWEKSRGQVMAWDRISLFGITLIERRRVSYAAIDPVASREIFLREGLATMQLDTRAPFHRHNLALLAEIRQEEEKLRRPEIMVSEERLHDFFASRIPAGICDTRSLENWARGQQQKHGRSGLELRREDLLAEAIAEKLKLEFPDRLAIRQNQLKIAYRFEPGADGDGATVDVPLDILQMMTQIDLDWAVPGTLPERSLLAMKNLPKHLRKQFVPLPDYIEGFLRWHAEKDNSKAPASLLQRLCEYARISRGIRLEEKDFDLLALPAYLQPWIRVLNEKGELLACSQSLAPLQAQFAPAAVTSLPGSATHEIERQGLKDWSFGDLPESVLCNPATGYRRYPALVDQNESVALILQDDPAIAERLTRQGLCRLACLRSPQQKALIQSRLKTFSSKLTVLALHKPMEIQREGLNLIVRQAFDLEDCRIPRTRDEFEQLLMQGKPRLLECAGRFEALLLRIIDLNFEINRRLGALNGRHLEPCTSDVREQTQALLHAGYLESTPAKWLPELPRYLQAILMRLDRLSGNLTRDSQSLAVVKRLHDRRKAILARCQEACPEQDDTRWLLEELRVSLFAQSLGTRFPVSEKRVERALEELERNSPAH
jgi:ATP-dependent helicase HrpA